jgi:hypothetical protein
MARCALFNFHDVKGPHHVAKRELVTRRWQRRGVLRPLVGARSLALVLPFFAAFRSSFGFCRAISGSLALNPKIPAEGPWQGAPVLP